jgi:hypothetical protein
VSHPVANAPHIDIRRDMHPVGFGIGFSARNLSRLLRGFQESFSEAAHDPISCIVT